MLVLQEEVKHATATFNVSTLLSPFIFSQGICRMSASKVPKIVTETPTSKEPTAYVPPAEMVLAGLGIEKSELDGDQVTVSARYLKFLVAKLAASAAFDPIWYASTYPDVEGARLAGEISSLKAHFIKAGYVEGRFPSQPPFDPKWYHEYYGDIRQTFRDRDVQGLWNHFLSKGYYEGRVGVPELVSDAGEWAEAGRRKS